MKTVIFACVHNAGRSQMAAAFLNVLADPGKMRAISAGTQPGVRVHPEVLTVMKEVGIDLSGAVPQKLTPELARGAARLFTLGCGENCPVIPGVPVEDWPLPDPKGKELDDVRAIRDEVRRRVQQFLEREGEMGDMAAETELLREVYAALNRNDVPAFMKAMDPEIEWIDPPGVPGEGTHRGHAAVKAHVAKSRANWAEGRCEPERFIVAGDRIVTFDHVRVRLKDETEWREGRIANVFTFRDGKVIEARVFLERRQALEWAGARDPDAG